MEEALLHIPEIVLSFLQEKGIGKAADMNEFLEGICGVKSFFESEKDYQIFSKYIQAEDELTFTKTRREYGDFQTNETLATKICQLLKEKKNAPRIFLEPTFGKGNFIIAALKTFPSLKKVYGIEIFKPYVYQTKFSILAHFLKTTNSPPEIHLFHEDFFGFSLKKLEIPKDEKLLILGNPPWITNSQLSSLDSSNFPIKKNRQNLPGLMAITGKGAFDLGGSITQTLLEQFAGHNGTLALLIKNTVIRNVVFDQKKYQLPLGNLQKRQIDAKVEFDAKTEASLFTCTLNLPAEFTIAEYDFYTNDYQKTYGWNLANSKFVSDLTTYQKHTSLDEKSPFEWRSGLKHDCSKVMEFVREGNSFKNKLGEKFELEAEKVFGLIKSADLQQNPVIPRKFTILTQKKIGEETSQIQQANPKTWAYLESHYEYFSNRKSAIYRNNPKYAIFGIGIYSFAPYKVAISSMYKTLRFSLVKPFEGKPLMLDDTCYFIGFEKEEFAQFTVEILNHPITIAFLSSIAFFDHQRVMTKDILNRLDFKNIIEKVLAENSKNLTLSISDWQEFPNSNFSINFNEQIETPTDKLLIYILLPKKMIHPNTKLGFVSNEIGFGVVATQLIPVGTIIWTIDKFDSQYSIAEYEAMESKYREIIDFYAYQDGDGTFILCWDHARFINHSFKPNCLLTPYKFSIAIKDIQIGEQLLEDYGLFNLNEPMEALDEDIERTTVYPDDLVTYHPIWDQQIATVFPTIPQLDQPLKKFLSDEKWQMINDIIAEKRPMDSLLSIYFARKKLNNQNSNE